MTEIAANTLPRDAKGAVAPPPALEGPLGVVASAVAAWPGVTATAHWDFSRPDRVDGIDFYVGDAELGHIHLDGSIHLATPPALGAALVAEGLGRPFRYAKGWVEANVRELGEARATDLFRRNYDRLAEPA